MNFNDRDPSRTFIDDADLTSLELTSRCETQDGVQTRAVPSRWSLTNPFLSIQHEASDHILSPFDLDSSTASLNWDRTTQRSSPEHFSYEPSLALSHYNVEDTGYPRFNIESQDSEDWTLYNTPPSINPTLLMPGFPGPSSLHALSYVDIISRSNSPSTISPSDTYASSSFGSHTNTWLGSSSGSVGDASYDYGRSLQEENGEICQVCSESFRRTADLRRHMKKHAPPHLVCEVSGCQKAFYRSDKLRDHLRAAHGIEEEDTEPSPTIFTCGQCDQTFKRRTDLNAHQRRKHYRKHECSECNKTFGLRADLVRHKDTHGRSELRSSFKCTILGCDYKCSRKDNLLRHVRKKHGLHALPDTETLSKSL